MKNEKEESNSIINLEKELENEELEIYPKDKGSERCDKEINELYTIENWSEVFYHKKSKLVKERFIKLISNSEYKSFFDGLDYEYGINGKKKDIQKAFEIYKNNADNSTDTLSMYRMYRIYRNEYKNFSIIKRNRILEKYYLYKCYSYLPKHQIEGYSQLLNRFNVSLEVKMNVYYEDKFLTKFDKLINHLKKYNNYYKINEDDLTLVAGFIRYEYKDNANDKTEALDLLKPLICKTNLEVIYKLAIILLNDEDKCEILFEILQGKNYYRSFCDYAIYLFKIKKDTQKALKILKTALSNGQLRANYLYYDIFLNNIDFSKIDINKEFKIDILFLFELLINDIVTDGIYSYFEFFYLRKLCIKHWNLKSLIDINFIDYTKSFVNILLENTCLTEKKEEIEEKKKLIKSIYIRKDYFSEFHLSCGFLFFYGIENIIKIDLLKSLNKFRISFDNSDSKSYKRFCYSYICKIKQKLFNIDHNFISKEDCEESKKTLFDLYNNSIDKEYLNILSSSFFYYLSRLYDKQWGNPGNDIMEYICLERASESTIKMPGTGTIISYYRKKKSKNILERKEKYYHLLLNTINSINDCEGYGDDNSICPICMENKRNIMFLPCKHLFCNFCTEIIMREKKTCPICRQIILFHFDFSKIEKQSENK